MEAANSETQDSDMTMAKQLTAKRGDMRLHSAVREGNVELILSIINGREGVDLKEILSRQNQLGETPLYVAAECGFDDLVKMMISNGDVGFAGIKARNSYDAFHIAAKQGNLKVLKVLVEANPELSLTFDSSKTTPLHTAALYGHTDIVHFLLEKSDGLASTSQSNGKTALHSAARNGHLEIVQKLLRHGTATRADNKGQTALHKAVKGQIVEVVDVLINSDSSVANLADNRGNTALHIAVQKGRAEIVQKLLDHTGIKKAAVNTSGETALDTAEKTRRRDITSILQNHGVQPAKSATPSIQLSSSQAADQTTSTKTEREEHTKLESQRRKRRLQRRGRLTDKMHVEGLNNAINSTTVVAILIAAVAFAAIFSIPGQYADDPRALPPGYSLGEARIGRRREYLIFVVFDSIALFISLAVVIVQTSVVVIEREAKKQMMAVINKLMWIACVLISGAFIALSFVVMGEEGKGFAIGVAVIGTVIMVSTIGTMCYWVVVNQVEASRVRSMRKSSISRSSGVMGSPVSDPEAADDERQSNLYAV